MAAARSTAILGGLTLELPLAALFLSLAAVPARALEVGKASPDEFLGRSRAEPGRLHALIIGATWCHACKLLAAGLAARDASTSTAVGRAAWDEVESDLYGTGKLNGLLKTLRAPEPTSLPTVLVLRDGEALGMSFAGNNLPKLEAFLAEAETQPARRARKPANASMLCPGKPDWASYTLGISGYKSKEDASTDDFGRKILLSFAGAKASPRARLFAPPRTAMSPGTERARAEDGVFFTAEDPIAGRASLLEDVSRSTYALAALSSARGRDLRLVLTGHSGEDGMTVAYRTAHWFKDDPTATYDQDLQLAPVEVAAAVRAAARAGKTVRGLVTTCYAGRYAEAFMPGPDSAAAPTCAAFATLPDKPADGCYSNGTSLGVDYASKLLARRTCGGSQDGRSLHYAVAASTSGRDVPMLTSEYFLLYGPGAEFLGRGERAPAPPRGVQLYEMADGVRIYVDIVSNQVLRAFKGAERIPPPRMALLDCDAAEFDHARLDGENLSLFYLRPHARGDDVARCTPIVKLYWEPGDGGPSTSTVVPLEAGYGGWSPGIEEGDDDFRRDFGTGGPTISLDGMRASARVLLGAVIPAFSDGGAFRDLGGRLDRIREEVRPLDAPLAEAIGALMAEQAGGVERAANLPDAQVSTDTMGGVMSSLKSILESAELSKHGPPAALSADELIGAMLDGLSPSRDETADVKLLRLAHLAAAAQAELALHEEAKTSPEARRLMAQLETIKTCEQGLY